MKYLIQNKTEKEWQGKKFIEATLLSESEEEFKVSAWAGEFNDKEVWEGELMKNEKGYWKLVSPKAQAGANFKSAQIEKVMDRKEKSISSFQGNKESSIKIASTMRDAVLLAIAEYTVNKQSLDKLDECVMKWRHWLWEHYDVDIKDYEDAFN